MATPSKTLADLGASDSDVAYANSSQAILEFSSMVTGHSVQFPAFLTDFSQNFASTWNQEDVFGRSDPIATFQNTKRTISLAWDVPAGSPSRAKANLESYGQLIKMLYPGYITETTSVDTTGNATSDAAASSRAAYQQSMAKSPLIKIKFANLIKDSSTDNGLLGFVDGFSMKPDLSMGYFQTQEGLFPKVFSISCSFTVLHQHDLGFNSTQEWIGNANYPF
jgi:hypothetical protein